MKKLTIVLAAFSGFISLSYEILWARTFSFMTSGRAFAFPMCLGLFLLGVAIGAKWSKRYSARHETASPKQLQVVALFILVSSVAGWLTIPVMAWLASALGGASWTLNLYVICMGATLFGAQLPLLAHFGIPADARAGANISYLYMANILGSVSGSLLTGFVLLDVWPLSVVVTALSVLGISAGMALGLKSTRDARERALILVGSVGVALAVVAARPVAFDSLYKNLLIGIYEKDIESLKHVIEDRSGVIVVDDKDRIYGGGVYDGKFTTDLLDDSNGIIRPFSLSAFHAAPKKVLMIGLGSGSWSEVIAHHPQVEEIVIVEIGPGYLKLAEYYPELDALLKDERVRVVIDDGRRWLHGSDERFDAIISNTTWHWRSMASNLLSVEFFELIKAHLEPGGVFMVNTTGSRAAALSAIESFEDTYLVLNTVVASPQVIDFDPERLRATLLNYTLNGAPVIGRDEASMQALDQLMIPFKEMAAHRASHPDQTYLESIIEPGGEAITDWNMGEEWDMVWLPNLLSPKE